MTPKGSRFYYLQPANVTLFGDKTLADVTQRFQEGEIKGPKYIHVHP